MPKPRIMFYHDGRHPLIYMYEPPMLGTKWLGLSAKGVSKPRLHPMFYAKSRCSIR